MGCIKVNPDPVSTSAAVLAPAVQAEVGTQRNVDGPDLLLGFNSPILGWVLHSAFGLVWAFNCTPHLSRWGLLSYFFGRVTDLPFQELLLPSGINPAGVLTDSVIKPAVISAAQD